MFPHAARSTDNVTLPVEDVIIQPSGLPGILHLPEHPHGIVIFAHGSGSSRLSPRNSQVAEGLGAAGFATLLFDLLTHDEAIDRRKVFDIPLLADRLVNSIKWVEAYEKTSRLPIGLFGASTGAAAALIAAAAFGRRISAVVSRGGRPDLAACAFSSVSSPTLLIVGAADRDVLALNEDALAQLRCQKKLTIVPGATHLFDEPGALEAVIREASDWFTARMTTPRRQARAG
ncbi:dienelactone hydrolase family protein [Rhizobiales bacterium]|uniref:dienelactone hydrolase family protein n=1 Tax=Hongsoonwoonella zoysiae TaxID=2821844 RepID=UPI0015613C2B|nr:alpha/beta family hydrolase [Hongsoonwoonella zoysiae]NRG18737.1 dienelactone hydrolase family protein [Hongsoonwoonella zoysiae]